MNVQQLQEKIDELETINFSANQLRLVKKIDALEKEVNKYRAIGTVEEIEKLKQSALSALELAHIWALLEILKEYDSIGTVEECRAAVEKQTAKKSHDKYHCDVCGAYLCDDDGIFGKYCTACGQKYIYPNFEDWSEEE